MLRNSLLGRLPSCYATLPHSRDRSLGHSEGWAPALLGTDTWQPRRDRSPRQTPHTKRGQGGLAKEEEPGVWPGGNKPQS